MADGDGGRATDYATFTILNLGKADLKISDVDLTAGDTVDFDLVNNVSSPVAPSASTSFTVRFDPVNPGKRSAAVGIGNNVSDGGTYTFTVTGTASTEPESQINVRGDYYLGTVVADGDGGEAGDYCTYTIENKGIADLIITSLNISGNDPDDFDLVDGTTTPVAPGAETTFTIRFDPLTAGHKSSVVTINNNDTDESVYIFTISGSGIWPHQQITASDGQADDCFGRSVSISGDYAIIGAPYYGFTDYTGCAYIFCRDGGNWI